MQNKGLACSFDTPPPTPVSRHHIGDPDVSLVEGSETVQNMANNAVFFKLPEFWETSAAQFALRGVTDDAACYFHIVSALGSSTATRTVGFITSPPAQNKYAVFKAFLLKTFELSRLEQARRLFAIHSLGDSKPSDHMEMMLNLLGTEEPNFLFMELFLRHMPPHVQTALANTAITEPRALAEEANRFFLATQRFTHEVLAHHAVAPPLVEACYLAEAPWLPTAAPALACVISMHASARKRRGAVPPATTRQREAPRPALSSGRECGHIQPAPVHQGHPLRAQTPL